MSQFTWGRNVTEPGNLQNDAGLEVGVPAAPLEAVLCTEELLRRPRRRSDHEMENSALAALVAALADSPRTILQTLADKVLEVLSADSAGLSLLTKDGKKFYWAALPGLGGHTSAVAPRAILVHAAMCSTTMIRCCSAIGSADTHT